MKLTRKEASKIGSKASWTDPEAKKKSLALGRAKSYKARREAGKNSFTDEHRNTLRNKKLKQYHNYLAIYLIENKMTSKRIMEFTKRLNTPDFYINDLMLKQAIERFLTEVNKEREGVITFDKAFELITKSLNIKKELFPNQIAPVRARESRKAKDKENRLKNDTKEANTKQKI